MDREQKRAAAVAKKAAEREAKAAERQARRDTRREFAREQQRLEYQRLLVQLPFLVDKSRIKALLEEYAHSDDGVAAETRTAFMVNHPTAAIENCSETDWIYGVHPFVWRLAVYDHFFSDQNRGKVVRHTDVARWVLATYPKEQCLYELFIAQYRDRSESWRAGFPRTAIRHWAFTDEENALIPNFYRPIDLLIAAFHADGVAKDGPEKHTSIVTPHFPSFVRKDWLEEDEDRSDRFWELFGPEGLP